MSSLKISFPYLQHALGLQTSKGRRAIEKLDLLLLAVEALDIRAPYALEQEFQNIDTTHTFSNGVEIWKSRCHNPMRKSTRNSPISKKSFEALLLLLSSLSQIFYPQIRELLSTKTPEAFKSYKWQEFCSRFDDLINERMNIRRASVKKYLEKSHTSTIFYKKLLFTLALSSGPNGIKRLSASIFDPI